MMIDADLAKFVDDDGDAAAMIRRQDAVEQRGFARAQKAGQDDNGGFLGRAVSSMATPFGNVSL